MTVAPNAFADHDPQPIELGVLQHLTPAAGWYLLTVYDAGGPNRRTYRWPVAAWGTYFGTQGTAVVPMIASDGGVLVPALEEFSTQELRLWRETESWCSCRDCWHDPSEEDDITWCSQCAGVIGAGQ
jgi:hypothetical protein